MQKLAHTGLTVRDLDRSVAFYRDVIGMKVVVEQEKQGGYLAEIVGYGNAHVRMAHLEFEPHGHRIELFEYSSPGRAAKRASRGTWGSRTCVSPSMTSTPSSSA
jgi:catechol 2,3-dioxygenase-like lactoylglutathione lyase family enzyme